MNTINRKRFLTFVFLGVLATGLWAEDAPTYGSYLGWGGGTSTGVGFSYRSWEGTFGLQLTALPVFTENFQFGSLGVTALWTLQDLKWTKFFTYLGASTMANRSWESARWNARTAAGAGFGFEFLWFDHIAFDLMAGYGFEATLPRMTTFGTTFSVESGLFYRTKL